MHLNKQKNIIPILRFPEFKVSWEEKSLQKIADLKMGQSPSSNAYNENKKGLPLIQGNADCKDRKTKPRLFTSEITKECFPGEIIMTVRAPVGTISKSFHHACIGRGVCSIRPKNNNDFLYQFLIKFELKWVKYSQGSTFTAVNSSDIKNLKITLPSNESEQLKISLFLTSVDNKIDQLTKKKKLLEKYKQGVMQKIFSQEIRFKDDDGGEYSEWEKELLGNISHITTGSSNKVDSLAKGDFAFFDRSGDVLYSNKFLFEGNAIIVAGEGSDFPPKFFSGKFDLHQRAYAILNFRKTIPKFLYYLLFTKRNYFLSMAVGSTVKSLRLPIFLKMPINLPSINEQQKIASFITSIDYKIDQINTQLEHTKLFKTGLLQKMFI